MMPPKSTRPKVPKRSAGLVISPPAPRPPDDNPALQIFREAKEAEARSPAVPPGATHHPPPTTHPPPTNLAPARDFSRVANSIARDALPGGLFRGESKKLYDALYLRTRGSVVPRRAVRATQAELMDWAGVSHNTLKAHLKHLSKVGLLKVHYVRGDNTGAEYEVLLPEEAQGPPTTHHPPPNLGPPTTQNLGPPTTQNLVLGGGGQEVGNSTTYEEYKTSFKTNTERTDDDEAFGRLLAAAKEITGREATGPQWSELVDVLVTELKIAAGRTTVSSVPAFLAEHLRRRLWKKDKRQIAEETKTEIQQSATAIDTMKCPDCFGTGMWYPEGYEKGVARCRHEKLTTEVGK